MGNFYKKRGEEIVGMVIFLITGFLTFGSMIFGGKPFLDFLKSSLLIFPFVVLVSVMLISSMAVIPFILSFFNKKNDEENMKKDDKVCVIMEEVRVNNKPENIDID